jgi:trimeric autotransporter adhesin
MNRMIQLKQTTPIFLIALVTVCLGLSPTAQAVVPAPDGGYPNGNTAEGRSALFSLTTGSDNTANGNAALYHNTSGNENTANGFNALYYNTSGDENTATGVEALWNNTTGRDNTATGLDALHYNTSGSDNTATGSGALLLNTTGRDNTAIGVNALSNNMGNNNIAIGSSAGSGLINSSNNIDIGALGLEGDQHTIRIGKGGLQTRAFVQGISGVSVAGSAVHVNAGGQLGVAASSARFKEAIKPMDNASEAILGLKPVTFRYKKEIDPEAIPQFGLVAEEVEKVNPDLILRDKEGKPYSVRYDQVNAMLLNEFLKEHKTVQEQGAMITELKKEIAGLVATVKEQAAQIQKVSAQVEVSKAAPQTVLNSQ